MKNSKEESKSDFSRGEESCNEQKCATCFENRGCMYEFHVSTHFQQREILKFHEGPSSDYHRGQFSTVTGAAFRVPGYSD